MGGLVGVNWLGIALVGQVAEGHIAIHDTIPALASVFISFVFPS